MYCVSFFRKYMTGIISSFTDIKYGAKMCSQFIKSFATTNVSDILL